MRSLLIAIASIALATTIAVAAGDAEQDVERQLKAAMNTELVDGNLKLAIEQYRKVAESGNRALAAQALLRMADCYQKLGDREAQTIYERLVRDYGDQKAAAASALARLGARGATAAVRGDRAVWSSPEADGFGTISPDGRFLTYTDWITGRLALRDLVAGTDHPLTTGTYDDGMTQFSAISKDGKQVAYQWMDTKVQQDARRFELRVAKLQGASLAESRRLFDDPDVTSAAPSDWSSDGKWIALNVRRKDLTNQVALVSVSDGALKVLKSLDWPGTTKIFFSPDGQYVAFDAAVAGTSNQQHVHIMSIDGTQDTAVVVDSSQNIVMGWSPDGRQLLFASDRSGSVGLWAMPLAGGKAQGTATLLKPDISTTWSLGLTASGTMYVWKYSSPVYLQTSAIDLNTGKLVAGTSTTFQRFIGSRGRPDWSADGKRLAYVSCAPLGGGRCTLWIRSMDTGELRELRTVLAAMFFPRWSPDGRELLMRGTDRIGLQGLFRVDVQTGAVTVVASPSPGNALPQWAADGKQVYYRKGSSIAARDLATGAERDMGRLPGTGFGEFSVSPDGRDVAYVAEQPGGGADLFVMPLAGGSPRSLLHVTAPERLVQRFNWTWDGRAIAVSKEHAITHRKELWLLPVNDDKPRKLDIDVDNWLLDDGFRLDRAGKQIAFVAAAGKPGLEIRALENFLPTQTGAKPTAKR